MTKASFSESGGDGMPAPPILTDVDADALSLVASAEPAVVFSSLARLSVDAFSDSCTVDIVEHERVAYRISYPLADNVPGDRRVPGHGIATRFASTPGDNGPTYFGVVTHAWLNRRATAADASYAQLLTDRAVAAVTDERRADPPSPSDVPADAVEFARAQRVDDPCASATTTSIGSHQDVGTTSVAIYLTQHDVDLLERGCAVDIEVQESQDAILSVHLRRERRRRSSA